MGWGEYWLIALGIIVVNRWIVKHKGGNLDSRLLGGCAIIDVCLCVVRLNVFDKIYQDSHSV